MRRVASSYQRPIVMAAMSALLELAVALQAYRGSIVLVGGWVPFFLLRDHGSGDIEHVGSMDIDLAVNVATIDGERYSTIVQLIGERGWAPWEGSRFTFMKGVASPLDGIIYDIRVDFLAPEPTSPAGRHRHRAVQPDLLARRARGAALALSHRTEMALSGDLPGDGRVETSLLMADIVACVGMKGLALGSRYSEKDAYDLVSVVDGYRGGPLEVAAVVRPFVGEPMMAEALGTIREMFRDERAAGSEWTAAFVTDARDDAYRAMVMRAHMVMTMFVDAVRTPPSRK
jgi:hypothetical protein